MSFQVCLKTHKSLRKLASEMQKLLCLPPYSEETLAGAPYCQFEMFGMIAIIQQMDEEDRDPEVADFPYCLSLQMAFTDNDLNTDELEYQLQPYYAQLLAFHLNIETAFHEKHKVGPHWQIRYHYCRKNPIWDGSILFGEDGWIPAVLLAAPTPWRTMHPVF